MATTSVLRPWGSTSSRTCGRCDKGFSKGRPRHLCALCSSYFCAKCAPQRWVKKHWGERVCRKCWATTSIELPSREDLETVPRTTLVQRVVAAEDKFMVKAQRVMELEDILQEAHITNELLRRREQALLLRCSQEVDAGSSVGAGAPSAPGGHRAVPHTCTNEVEVKFKSGHLGLELGPAAADTGWGIVIEAVVEAGPGEPPGQAAKYNASLPADDCCGHLRKGMLLVAVNGKSLAGLSYALASRTLREARHPVTLRFREVALMALRLKHLELESRYSILSIQYELNENLLREEAATSFAHRRSMTRKLAVLARSYKKLQADYDRAQKEVEDLTASNEQLVVQERDLRMSLSSTLGRSRGIPMFMGGSPVSRQTEDKLKKELANVKNDLDAAQRQVMSLSGTVERQDAELTQLRAEVVKAEAAMREVALNNEQLKAVVLSQSDPGPEGSNKVLVDKGLWELYMHERQRSTLLEDEVAKQSRLVEEKDAKLKEIFESFSNWKKRWLHGVQTGNPTAAPPTAPAEAESKPKPRPKSGVFKNLVSNFLHATPKRSGSASSRDSAKPGRVVEVRQPVSSDTESDDGETRSRLDSEASIGSTPALAPTLNRVPTAAAISVAHECLDASNTEPVLAQLFSKCSRNDGARLKTYWRKRFVVVCAGTFTYYKKETDIHARGSISLEDVERVEALDARDFNKSNAFEVKVPGQTIYLCAPDADTRARWVGVLQACLYVLRSPPGGDGADSDDDDDA